MRERPVRDLLEDILEAIGKIESYTSGLDFNGFSRDDMCIDAVLRNFEIIGEAAGKLPASLKDKYPEVPWRQMTNLRNIVSHEYFGIDCSIIWQIIKVNLSDLPPLIKEIQDQESR